MAVITQCSICREIVKKEETCAFAKTCGTEVEVIRICSECLEHIYAGDKFTVATEAVNIDTLL